MSHQLGKQLFGVIVSALLGIQSAKANEPLQYCELPVFFWPQTPVAQSIFPNHGMNEWQNQLAAYIAQWNKNFPRQGYFRVQGEMTMAEWKAKRATLSFQRVQILAKFLEKIAIPSSHIRLATGTYPIDYYPNSPLGWIQYCWDP